jgi:hypothetical protein
VSDLIFGQPPKFIQIACAPDADGEALYALDESGEVWWWAWPTQTDSGYGEWRRLRGRKLDNA